jgi:hypothetical protein
MRIAIFGDSFTNHELDNNSIGKSWVDIVAEHNEVVNFGASGSCFQYSYELFLKERDNFDAVIFFVTNPDRKYIKLISNALPTVGGNSHMLNSTHCSEHTKKLIADLDLKDKDFLIKIIDNHSFYFNNYRDIEFELHLHDLMIKNITTLKPNALIVPCFPNSIGYFIPKDTVYTINVAEVNSLDVDLDNVWVNYHCLRKCHLSEENNIILGNKILQAMNMSINYLDLNVDDFITKLDKPTEYYLKKA